MRSAKVMRRNPNMLSSDDVSLPTLPFDLISEILSRLPIKSLLQFRCVSKSWNFLISDPKFARKHLNLSTTRRRVLCLSYDSPSYRYILNSYPLQSIFTDTDGNSTRFEYPLSKRSSLYYVVGSCDGIICFANHPNFFDSKPLLVLWNPSIGKFKELPPFENLNGLLINGVAMSYGLGYDHVSNDYKVVVIYNPTSSKGHLQGTTQAKVYTLNTDSWRTIQPFPFGTNSNYTLGSYVSGSINWMSYNQVTQQRCIVSLDLCKESYQIILPPPDLKDYLRLSVLRDCLCIISNHDVWVMKEYGIQDSWTKFFNVTHLLDPPSQSFILTNLLYIFEQDQMLLLFEKARERILILYNFKNDTSKVCFMLKDIPQVCVESLISPVLKDEAALWSNLEIRRCSSEINI